MGLFRSRGAKSSSPFEQIAMLKERKDAKGLFKFLQDTDNEIADAAIDALDEIKGSLKTADWHTLLVLKGKLPNFTASRLSWLLLYPQSALGDSFKSVHAGMSANDVTRIMGKPDRIMSGRDFVQAYRLGVMLPSGRDMTWLASPHWIYTWKDDPRSCYVIELSNGAVTEKQSVDMSS